MKKILAIMLLSLGLSACESGAPDNSASTASSKPTPAMSTPSPVAPGPVSAPSASARLKTGDSVKVTINGTIVEATVVSVDEKTGKVTVKLKKDGKEKTVSASDIEKS